MRNLILAGALVLTGLFANAQEAYSKEKGLLVAQTSDNNDRQTARFIKQHKSAVGAQLAGTVFAVVAVTAALPELAIVGGAINLYGLIAEAGAGKTKNFKFLSFKKESDLPIKGLTFEESKYYQKYLKKSAGKKEKTKQRLYLNFYTKWKDKN